MLSVPFCINVHMPPVYFNQLSQGWIFFLFVRCQGEMKNDPNKNRCHNEQNRVFCYDPKPGLLLGTHIFSLPYDHDFVLSSSLFQAIMTGLK